MSILDIVFPLLIALAPPSAAEPATVPLAASTAPAPELTPPPGTLDSSKIRIDAHDVSGALADAQLVISKGGGAEAYAARADALRAEGGHFDEVLADYARAAKLDPRYIEKYQGLIAQRDSEEHPQKSQGDKGLNGVPVSFIASVGAASLLCIAAAVVISRRRGRTPPAPDDEEIEPDGKVSTPSAAGEAPAAVTVIAPPGGKSAAPQPQVTGKS